MQNVTSIVDYSYRGTMNGQEYKGTAKSTEGWLLLDGPVDEGSILRMHLRVWIARMKEENGVKVHPKSVRVLSSQILT